MFGNRSAQLEKIINEETGKLTDRAKEDLARLQPIVVVEGNQGGFIPISDTVYKTLNEDQKSAEDHKLRVDYILSRKIEIRFH